MIEKCRKILISSLLIFILASFALIVFGKNFDIIYCFNIQNIIMILLLTIVFLKYYRNYFKHTARIIIFFAAVCMAVNLVGLFVTDKYEYYGLKAICENRYYLTLFVCIFYFLISIWLSKKCDKNNTKDHTVYIDKIMKDDKLYESHKYDAEYIIKFLFESKLKTLGVSGRYGTGKTIIIREIMKFTKSSRNIYVEITPLACSIEEMPTYIVGQIEKVLKSKGIYTDNTRQIINTIQNGYLSSLMGFFDKNQTLSELYFNLCDMVKSLDLNITIIVDDLDRVYDVKQIETIFIILDSIVSEKCKIIYLYDSEGLSNKFQEKGGYRYIEKYIQDEYTLKNLSFRDLVLIENDIVRKTGSDSKDNKIYEMIRYEANYIENSTRIYRYSGDDLGFDKYKLTPRMINKIVHMTYKRLSDIGYRESIKGFERIVFRFYIFDFYFPGFKHQIHNKIKFGSYFTFNYKNAEMTLEQVLEKYFDAMAHALKDLDSEKQFAEYVDFVHSGNNADKLLALEILGYSIDTFRKYIMRETMSDASQFNLHPNEVAYNNLFINLNYDAAYNNIMYNNDKIARIVSNLISLSNSEYTDDERFVKDFRTEVLSKTEMVDAFKKYKFNQYKDNSQTTDIIGLDEFTSIFNSFKKGVASEADWNRMMELYYMYLVKNDDIIFSDDILKNINLFGFCSYTAGIYAFMIMSKFIFKDYENKYLDVLSIPKLMMLIKEFLENYFEVHISFYYSMLDNCVRNSDIDECRNNLPEIKKDLTRFIKALDDIDEIIKNKHQIHLSYIRVSLEKLIELIDNSGNYMDSIKRNHIQVSFRTHQRDISKYQGKSMGEIDKMFDEDLCNGVLLPIDYKRIMDEFNNE